MEANACPADSPFFTGHLEMVKRGIKRDVRLFGILLEELGVDTRRLPPILAVVGSKGKGTCAAAASQYLHSQGRQVVTVTSPHYIAARERLRINGRPVDKPTYARLSARLSETLGDRPHLLRSPIGYLSPVGRFLAAGCLLSTEGADCLVVEAGMGGWSDEVSLLPISVLGVLGISEEHLGVLGDTLDEIAEDKIYAALLPSVRAVVTLGAMSGRHLGRIESRRHIPTETLSTLRASLDPFGAANASIGYVAGAVLLDHRTGANFERRVSHLWRDLTLPGRNQLVERDGRTYIVNSAATREGVTACVLSAEQRYGSIDTLVLCIPDGRGPRETLRELPGRNIVWANTSNPKFENKETVPKVGAEVLTDRRLGNTVFVSGVVGFAGEALRALGVSETSLKWWPSPT